MKPQYQQPFQQNVQRQQKRLQNDQMAYDWMKKREAEKAAQAGQLPRRQPHIGIARDGFDVNQVHTNARRSQQTAFKANQKNSPTLAQWLSGCVTFLMGIVITIVAGFVAGNIAFEALFDHDKVATWLFAGAVWLTGLLISTSKARKRVH